MNYLGRGLPEGITARAADDFAAGLRFSQNPFSADIATEFVASAKSLKDPEEVARRLGRLLALQPDEKASYLPYMRALNACRRFADAMKIAKSAIERFPGDAELVAEAAHIALGLTEFELALDYAKRAWGLNPRNGFAFDTMYRVLRETGHLEELKDFLQGQVEVQNFAPNAKAILEKLPSDSVGFFEQSLDRIALAIRKRDWAVADNLIKSRLSAFASSEVERLMGDRAFRQKLLFLVLRLRVCEEVPDTTGLADAREFEAARREAILGLKSRPIEGNNATAFYFLLGKLCFSVLDDAKGYFRLALACDPSFLPAHIWLQGIDQGFSPPVLFAALGVPLSREWWKYRMAAALLDIHPPHIAPSTALEGECAICVRGICDLNTPLIVRYYRHYYPECPIIVSTWAGTDPALIAAIKPFATKVLLQPDPKIPGFRNTNRQIANAYGALSEAERMGTKMALLVRTDFILFRPHLLRQLRQIVLSRSNPQDRHGPLVIPDAFTRKWIPRHPSDMIMFGATADMLGFWSAAWQISTELDVQFHDSHPEVYLTRAYLDFCGRSTACSSDQEWMSALAEMFIVKNFEWFGALWLKQPGLRGIEDQALWLGCISESDWETIELDGGPCHAGFFSDRSSTAIYDQILDLPRF